VWVCVSVCVCVCVCVWREREEYVSLPRNGEPIFFVKFHKIIVPFEVTCKFVHSIPYYPQYLHYGHANFWAESSTNGT